MALPTSQRTPKDTAVERSTVLEAIPFRFAFAIAVLSLPRPAIFIPPHLWFDSLRRPVALATAQRDVFERQTTNAIGAFLVRIVTGGKESLRELIAKFKNDWFVSAIPDLLGLLTLAVAIAAVWTALEWRRTDYRLLNRRMRVYPRYGLATAMLSYAFVKAIPTQFNYLTPGELLRPFGQLSRFRVLWDFMAVSSGYTIFTGLIELFGAVLLFFRRTTPVGGIVLAGALMNVVAMDFAYGVGALTYALALLPLDILVLAPYLRPLFEFLLVRGSGALPSEPSAPQQRYPWREYPRCRLTVLMILLTGATLAQERPLESVVQGTVTSSPPQIYTLSAGPGDVVFGTFDLKTAEAAPQVAVALYDERGTKLKELVAYDPGKMPIGFVTPKNGAYHIQITSNDPAGGSYTLTTKRQTPAERAAGVTVTPTVRFESPRVTQLAKDASHGQAGAVERFWSKAKAGGGPLIETIKEDDKDFLVTFLWKETYETHNVLVVWAGAAPQDYYMSHVPGTNVWYKTLRIRRGSRFGYQLAPNDRPGEPHYTAQRDPLNPRGVYDDSSVVQTPGAPDESWYSRTPAVRGSIAKHSLESVLLKRQREISVYTPPGYSPSSGPYPLLILFDGNGYLGDILKAPNTLDNLIAAHRIRPPVVCFVSDNRRVGRGQTRTYASAMATELVPWLRSSYAISTNPKDVVIGGFSAGGGAAGYTAFYHPDVFGNVLLQSGGIQVLVPLLINAPKLPVRFYEDQGLYEYGPTWPSLSPDEQAVDGWFEEGIPSQGQNWLFRARLLRTVLQAKGYDFQYHETGGGHEAVHWRATLAEGLMALLAPSDH